MNKKIVKGRIYNDENGSFIIDYEFRSELDDGKVFADLINEKFPFNLSYSDDISDLIDESIEQYTPVPLGVFNIYDIMNHIYETARTYVCEKLQDCIFYLEELDTESNAVSVRQIDLVKYIVELIEDRSTTEQSDCDAGGYVERSLELYEEKSTWNVGLKMREGVCTDVNYWPAPVIENGTIVWKKDSICLTPVMWFGPLEEVPLEQWTINSSENNHQFWFSDDVDQELEHLLSEPDGGFLYWFNWECAMQFPVLEDIIKRCPVSVSKEDTDEQILMKVNDYMLKTYLNSR